LRNSKIQKFKNSFLADERDFSADFNALSSAESALKQKQTPTEESHSAGVCPYRDEK
jgi:hypothetical protein